MAASECFAPRQRTHRSRYDEVSGHLRSQRRPQRVAPNAQSSRLRPLTTEQKRRPRLIQPGPFMRLGKRPLDDANKTALSVARPRATGTANPMFADSKLGYVNACEETRSHFLAESAIFFATSITSSRVPPRASTSQSGQARANSPVFAFCRSA